MTETDFDREQRDDEAGGRWTLGWIAGCVMLMVMLLLAGAANAQGEMPEAPPLGPPPTLSVEGSAVTIDGDFAVVFSADSNASVEVVQATKLLLPDGTFIASPVEGGTIQVNLTPGTYTITAFGHPIDPAHPARARAVFTVVIDPPTREGKIRSVLDRISAAREDFARALADLAGLAPTAEELAAAASPQP